MYALYSNNIVVQGTGRYQPVPVPGTGTVLLHYNTIISIIILISRRSLKPTLLLVFSRKLKRFILTFSHTVNNILSRACL